jgi:hypothetical protein
MENMTEEQEVAMADLLEHGGDELAHQIEVGVVKPITFADALGVKPQFIYNYIRGGRIKAHKTADTDKFVINVDDALTFATKYFAKQAEKAARIEEELAGTVAS